MRTSCFMLLCLSCVLLSACAPFNNIEPFDDKQAAILIQENNWR